MIEISIPSFRDVKIKYVVFDYNGTLALDGVVRKEIKLKLAELMKLVDVYVLTADTYGNAKENLKDTQVKLHIISKENGVLDKVNFVKGLGTEFCIAVGNGNNDSKMIKEANIGICILGNEGCSTKTFQNSDVIVKSIDDCLDMLLNSNRLKATLRG